MRRKTFPSLSLSATPAACTFVPALGPNREADPIIISPARSMPSRIRGQRLP